jgi:hypothetical protein
LPGLPTATLNGDLENAVPHQAAVAHESRPTAHPGSDMGSGQPLSAMEAHG